MLRIVLDPGVFVAALLADGPPAQIVDEWREGAYEIVVSPRLLSELSSVLSRARFRDRIDAGEIDELLEGLRRYGIATEDAPARRTTRDPKDDYLVALLDASAADILVSGDADLADFALKPRDFLERYGD